MGWRFGFAKVAAQVSASVEDFCKRIRADFSINWLQVLGSAELAQIDQRVRHQLHPIVPLLSTFKSEQEPFERIFPRKGALDTHPQRMDGGVEEPLASVLRGLAVTGICLDIGDHAGIENQRSAKKLGIIKVLPFQFSQ
jgi:hypothetical protein